MGVGGGYTYIYSFYPLPNDDNNESLKSLDAIVANARSFRLPVVITEKFNVWATEWGSAETNNKTNIQSRALLDAFTILELVIANTGTTPT